MLKRGLLYTFILVMAINVCEARVVIGIGVGGGYPYNSYNSCYPGYWDNGYWVEGNCGNDYYYPSVYTGPAFIWGGYGGGGWHRHGGWGGGGGWHGGGGHGGGGGWHHH